jgi:hypothetical protein
MIRNQKVENAHRALRQFLTPKLRPGFALDCTPFFIGCDDGNIADKLDDVVGAVCRATSGDLTCDVAVPELKRKMKAAVDEPEAKTETKAKSEAPPVDESVVNRVLALLEMKLLPTELAAVRQILTEPSKKQRAIVRSEKDLGEDQMTIKHVQPSKKTVDDYASRFPNAMKIKREPSYAPVPAPMLAVDGKQTAPDPAGYASRFPSAMRIRQG